MQTFGPSQEGAHLMNERGIAFSHPQEQFEGKFEALAPSCKVSMPTWPLSSAFPEQTESWELWDISLSDCHKISLPLLLCKVHNLMLIRKLKLGRIKNSEFFMNREY